MKGTPTAPWGKLSTNEGNETQEWHPLAAHCADVGAVCLGLLESSILGERLAALLGRDSLSLAHAERLALLASLHDAGKANHGFQDRASGRAARGGGHVRPLLRLLLLGENAAEKRAMIEPVAQTPIPTTKRLDKHVTIGALNC